MGKFSVDLSLVPQHHSSLVTDKMITVKNVLGFISNISNQTQIYIIQKLLSKKSFYKEITTHFTKTNRKYVDWK